MPISLFLCIIILPESLFIMIIEELCRLLTAPGVESVTGELIIRASEVSSSPQVGASLGARSLAEQTVTEVFASKYDPHSLATLACPSDLYISRKRMLLFKNIVVFLAYPRPSKAALSLVIAR